MTNFNLSGDLEAYTAHYRQEKDNAEDLNSRIQSKFNFYYKIELTCADPAASDVYADTNERPIKIILCFDNSNKEEVANDIFEMSENHYAMFARPIKINFIVPRLEKLSKGFQVKKEIREMLEIGKNTFQPEFKEGNHRTITCSIIEFMEAAEVFENDLSSCLKTGQVCSPLEVLAYNAA